MNSIESLKLDFDSQVMKLNKIDSKKIFDDCVIVGSGDSYVVGLIIEYLSNYRCRCYSPSDLLTAKSLGDMTYCFISVSGKTKTNIELARRARQSGIKTIALTFNEKSELAGICKEIVVPFKMTKPTTTSAGFSAFVANVVTCLQMAGIDAREILDKCHKRGVALSSSLLESADLPPQTVYLLGNHILYPVAMYGCFKLAEFFGTPAIPHKLDEFCHSPIFGIRKTDHIWILGQDEKHISRIVEKIGTPVKYFEFQDSNILMQSITSLFCIQNLILLLAARHGYTDLHYLFDKVKLKTSSELIY